MNIRVRVIAPITSVGFRRPEDARALESDGVSVDFSTIDVGPASFECAFQQPSSKRIDGYRHIGIGVDMVQAAE